MSESCPAVPPAPRHRRCRPRRRCRHCRRHRRRRRSCRLLTSSTIIEPLPVPVPVPSVPLLSSPRGTRICTGWWRECPEPGEVGPAVIAGHVDVSEGHAVFFRLEDIEPGQEIFVDRADGSTARFVARRTEVHPKDEFPTRAVYDPTKAAQLRLITCGGDFDSGESSYVDNVIVYATSAAAVARRREAPGRRSPPLRSPGPRCCAES